MEKKKRERTLNFSTEETRLLVNIVLKYMQVIENKTTDAVTWKSKNETWEKIANEFNSQSGKVHRTSKVLHLKYDVLKRLLRKKQSNNKMQIYKTGGGPSVEISLTDFEEKLAQILSLSINGLPSRGDSDIQETISAADTSTTEQVQEETIILEYVDEAHDILPLFEENETVAVYQSDNSDCIKRASTSKTCHPANTTESSIGVIKDHVDTLTTKINEETHQTLRKKIKSTPSKKKDVLFNKYGNIAESRSDLIELQKKYYLEESDRREREHKYTMENLRLQREYMESEELRKQEQHRLYVEKLKLEINKLQ